MVTAKDWVGSHDGTWDTPTRVEVPYDPVWDAMTELSLSFKWTRSSVEGATLANHYGWTLVIGNPGTNDGLIDRWAIWIRSDPSTNHAFVLWYSGGPDPGNFAGSLPLGFLPLERELDVVTVMDGTDFYVWVNGIDVSDVDTAAAMGSPAVAPLSLLATNEPGPYEAPHDTITNLTLWTRALTPAEIQAISSLPGTNCARPTDVTQDLHHVASFSGDMLHTGGVVGEDIGP